ncbi:MAG: hypothetical protein ACK5PF_11215 [bacterium]
MAERGSTESRRAKRGDWELPEGQGQWHTAAWHCKSQWTAVKTQSRDSVRPAL